MEVTTFIIKGVSTALDNERRVSTPYYIIMLGNTPHSQQLSADINLHLRKDL